VLLTRDTCRSSPVRRDLRPRALASANPRIGPFNAATRFRDYKYQRYRESDALGTPRLDRRDEETLR